MALMTGLMMLLVGTAIPAPTPVDAIACFIANRARKCPQFFAGRGQFTVKTKIATAEDAEHTEKQTCAD